MLESPPRAVLLLASTFSVDSSRDCDKNRDCVRTCIQMMIVQEVPRMKLTGLIEEVGLAAESENFAKRIEMLGPGRDGPLNTSEGSCGCFN